MVQYVLDLDDIKFAEMIIHPFLGNVTTLSMQKFSSNVIEKVGVSLNSLCIRVASPNLRASLISELLDATVLDGLLRDSYANYVVQTALDFAQDDQKFKVYIHILSYS